METAAKLTALIAVLGIASVGYADETWRKDRFAAGLGWYRPNVDTQVRVADAESGISGTLLDLESDLDLKNRDAQVTFDLHWRFARRHAIEFEYVELKRKATQQIEFDIEYDDEVFAVDETLETVFDTSVSRLGYRFSFINDEKIEASASFGLHITDLKVGLNLVDEVDKSFNEVTAPLPAIGGAFKYRFNEQWDAQFRAEWLDIEVGDFDGSLTNFIAEVSWHPWKNFGFGLGYNFWELDVKVTDADLTGQVEYQFRGPKFELKARL